MVFLGRRLALLLLAAFSAQSCDSTSIESATQDLDSTYLHTFSRVSIILTGVFEREYGQSTYIDSTTKTITFFYYNSLQGNAGTGGTIFRWNANQFLVGGSAHFYRPPYKYGPGYSEDIEALFEGMIKGNSLEGSFMYSYVYREDGVGGSLLKERGLQIKALPLTFSNEDTLIFSYKGPRLYEFATDIYQREEVPRTLIRVITEGVPPPELKVIFFAYH